MLTADDARDMFTSTYSFLQVRSVAFFREAVPSSSVMWYSILRSCELVGRSRFSRQHTPVPGFPARCCVHFRVPRQPSLCAQMRVQRRRLSAVNRAANILARAAEKSQRGTPAESLDSRACLWRGVGNKTASDSALQDICGTRKTGVYDCEAMLCRASPLCFRLFRVRFLLV